MIDRLPPHAPDAEKCIIGSCLTQPADCLPEAQQTITTPEFFYDLRYRTVWETMQEMRGDEIDVISVHQKLKDSNKIDQIGGLTALLEFQDAVTSSANMSAWIEILQGKYLLRKTIQTCTNAIASAYQFNGADASELISELERKFLEIRPNLSVSSDINSLVLKAVDIIEKKYNNPGKLFGLSTGLMDLDRLSDGIHNGEMIVIAGFPSTGKTALAVGIAVENALQGIPAAIFSAEMRPVQLVVRSLCSNSRANYHHLNDGSLGRMVGESTKLRKAPLYIESAHGWTFGQVMASGRRLKQKHNIKMAVIDYIQLLQGIGDNREQQISSISKGVKAMALELDIPVLALSQLTDDGKLRESRSIGQDADTVWKLANDGEWQPKIQPIKLNIDKCRDGETGSVPLAFLKEYTRMESAAKISPEDVPQHNHE